MPENMPVQPEFPVLRKGGVDPEAVEQYLVELRRFFEQQVSNAQGRYANLEIELTEARKREEAVHLTLVAATKTKEELLVNAQRDADEMVATAKHESESLLGEAKKEAFRLVSEARQTAEDAAAQVRTEAERIKTEAEASAEATRDAARREAIEMINSVESDTAAVMAAQDATVADMRRSYEEEEAELAARIEVLRATASDLETRLKAIATGSLGQAANLVAETPAPTVSDAAPAVAEVKPEPAPVAPEPVAPEPVANPEPEPAQAAPEPVAAAAKAAEPAPITAPEPPTVAPKARTVRHDLIEAAVDEELAASTASIEETSKVVEPVAEVAEIEQIEPPAAAKPAPDELPGDELESTPEPAMEDEETDEELEPVPAAVGAPAAQRDNEPEPAGGRKGSYYSRRSAKLPRIGTEAGRSALAAANAIRGATRGTPTEPPDVTAKTA